MTKQGKAKLHHKYRGLLLDEFQREALWHIQKNTSLLISAPTGTGKTLIADYLIDLSLKANKRVIYTAPIKALVNQKYQDFIAKFGRHNIGMATGDLSINLSSPALVVTTEIFRNMLLRQDNRLANLNWVIFDEIHYLNHQQRGTVWEESILLKPPGINILGLSATVPNIEQIAQWIRHIQGEPIEVITLEERAVPLSHYYFNQACEAINQDQILESLANTALADRDEYDFKAGALSVQDLSLPSSVRYQDPSRFVDVVKYLKRNRLFPALYFVFSRRGCEEKAKEIGARYDFLRFHDKQQVNYNVNQYLGKYGIRKGEIPQFDKFFNLLNRGIGIHHAGLLPVVKQITEQLLDEGLIRILFATETFAVGVNMPVRTVCFDQLKKYDGNKIRYLTQQEYFQMAGRAGRRGRDKQGIVLSQVNFSRLLKEPLPTWSEGQLEPITSKFSLSYNMVLNLLANFPVKEIPSLLQRTFLAYTHPEKLEDLLTEFDHKREILFSLDYLDESNWLTDKGETGRHIYVEELFVTELIFGDHLTKLKPRQLAGLASTLVWDHAGKLPIKPTDKWLLALEVVREQVARTAKLDPQKVATITPVAAHPVMAWVKGESLEDILKQFPLDPGDFVQLCRRAIDLLRQIQSAAPAPLGAKAKQAVTLIDKGVVQVKF